MPNELVPPEVNAEISQLRGMLDVLFHFLRSVPRGFVAQKERPAEITPVYPHSTKKLNEFYSSLVCWIQQLVNCIVFQCNFQKGSVLLRVASFEDHIFLIRNLLQVRGSGTWGASLIQFPSTWCIKVFLYTNSTGIRGCVFIFLMLYNYYFIHIKISQLIRINKTKIGL